MSEVSADITIGPDDPRTTDVTELLTTHLDLMRRISPPGHVHALDLDRLSVPAITFLSARAGGVLLGVGAFNDLGGSRGEIKSMHTAEAARGRGVGRQLVRRLLDIAAERELTWVGLETGTQPEFEPARTLYASFGFSTCPPFDDYTVNPYSTCMSLVLTP